MFWLLTGIGAALLLVLLLRWWAEADSRTARNTLLALIVTLCLLLCLALVAAGKGLFALIPGGYTLIRLLRPLAGPAARAAGQRWQGSRTSGRPPERGEPMNRAEALEILGLDENASRDDIVAAHRRLIAQLHPDKGGSDWMAAKVNAARARLLDDF